MIIAMFVRWLLTGVLLAVVWSHTHWSVALTLTGLCVANELVWLERNR